jgi:hypothetical protein
MSKNYIIFFLTQSSRTFYYFCIIFLLFVSFGNAQVCESGEAVASNSSICSGTNTTISVIVPKGSIVWQQSSDGSNWVNVSSGSSVTNIIPASVEVENFSYTGSEQTFIVPKGVTSIIANGYGAAGGHGSSDFNARGGLGGQLEATLTTTPEETLYIYIGEQGHNTIGNPGTGQQANNLWVGSDGLGGFNGGGNATSGSGGGGGSTDIRQNGNTLLNRIFVVGSGGGGGNQRRSSESGGNGGNGGGLTGASGINGAGGGIGGGGGSQIAGGSASGGNGATFGSLGQGGLGATAFNRPGGGGGGGYYGGGGGGHVDDRAGGGGGGGSSFTTGTITTNVQGDTAATGNGYLTLNFTIPGFVQSVYTTPNLTTNTYYRAVVTDVSCLENYSLPSLITVNALPTPTFTLQPQTAVSINSNVTYTTELGQTNYSWSLPGVLNTDYSGGTFTDNTIVLKWLTIGIKAITVNYSNSNNCLALVATSSSTIIARKNGLTNNGAQSVDVNESINRYGATGTETSVDRHGSVVIAKLGSGLTFDTAATSAYAIKQAYPSSLDGIYWIINQNINSGIPFQIYADMTTDDGGWMLLNVGAGTTAAPESNTLISPDVLGYLPRTTVIELAKLSTDVQLRAGNSSASYTHKTTSTSPLAIGALQSTATDVNGAATWANGASSTFVVNSGSWLWAYCCPGTAVGWPKMYHSSNYSTGVHWFADSGHGRSYNPTDAWFSTWIR